MSIADKLLLIAENEQKVYDAGYTAGVKSAPDQLGPILSDNVAVFSSDKLTTLRNYAFAESKQLVLLDLPNLRYTGTHSFLNCTSLENVEFPSLSSIGTSTFQGCLKLSSVNVPKLDSIAAYGFRNCKSLSRLKLPSVTVLGGFAFMECTSLIVLVLSGPSCCTLRSLDAFKSTPIESGTGYIYVPATLLDSYKTAANWSNFASQFRAIEDYTIDGTLDGELDDSKI